MNKKHLSLVVTVLFACFVALSAACTTPAGRTADEVLGDWRSGNQRLCHWCGYLQR